MAGWPRDFGRAAPAHFRTVPWDAILPVRARSQRGAALDQRASRRAAPQSLARIRLCGHCSPRSPRQPLQPRNRGLRSLPKLATTTKRTSQPDRLSDALECPQGNPGLADPCGHPNVLRTTPRDAPSAANGEKRVGAGRREARSGESAATATSQEPARSNCGCCPTLPAEHAVPCMSSAFRVAV